MNLERKVYLWCGTMGCAGCLAQHSTRCAGYADYNWNKMASCAEGAKLCEHLCYLTRAGCPVSCVCITSRATQETSTALGLRKKI